MANINQNTTRSINQPHAINWRYQVSGIDQQPTTVTMFPRLHGINWRYQTPTTKNPVPTQTMTARPHAINWRYQLIAGI